MKTFIAFTLSLFIILPACGGMESPNRSGDWADFVFIHGGVYTVNPEQPWAEAVAIKDGEIVFVGSDDDVLEKTGPETEVINLKGRMLLPGFHDAHIHLQEGTGSENSCSLFEIESLEAARLVLADCSDLPGLGDENWLFGGGWDRVAFGGDPDKSMLDEIIGERPVLFDSSDGHSVWVNSKALALAGIDNDTPDPPGGFIQRDPVTGEATGVFHEIAREYIDAVAPEPSLDQMVSTLKRNIALAHSFGITSIIEPGVDDAHMVPWVQISQARELNLRVLTSLSPIHWTPGSFGDEVYEFMAAREKYRGPNLKPDSIKIYMDGVLENGTAVLLQPYGGELEDYGLGQPHYNQDKVNEYFTRFDAMGIQLHIHALGDGGVRMALDGIEAARQANGPSDNRHHMVHLQLIDPEDIPRFAELNIGATFQPTWAYPDPWILEMNLPVVGQERVDRMYPIGSVHRAGGRIVGGSDWYVTTLDPLVAIETAIRRQDPLEDDGPVLNASERVDLATMLKAYTLNGAYTMSQENLVGSIEVGKKADLVVLDQNLFEIPVTEINEASVEMTFFEGEVVYTP